MKNDQVGKRIGMVQSFFDVSGREFARRIGRDSSYLSKVMRGLVGPSDGFLQGICEEFKVSFLWLKEGVGEMFTEEVAAPDWGGVPRRIRGLRMDRGLTQAEFARRIGCSMAMISSVEIGRARPSLKLMRRCAEEFGVEMEWLVGGKKL